MPTSYFKPPSTNLQSSTPAITPGQLTSPNFFGNLGFGQATQPTPPQYSSMQPGNSFPTTPALQASANVAQNSVVPTASGGVSFNPSLAQAYNKPAQTVSSNSTGSSQSGASGLAQYTNTNSQTPNGGTVSIDGNGNPSGYSSNGGFTIGTSGPTSSDALNGQNTASGLQNSYQTYQDLINAVSQAQGYSPAYQQAQGNVYNTQATGAQLGVNQAAYANQAFGSNQANGGNGLNYGNLGGATTDYVAGTIGSEQSGNAIKQAENTQQQTSANIALNTQQLARTGAISAAQTQLQYNPTAVSAENDINRYNTLQQQYPGANLPDYNPALSPGTNTQIAQELITNSPAYKAQFQQQYTTAGGGTGIYNKLDTGLLNQNSDGTISLVNDGAAITGQADKSAASTLTGTINALTPSYNAANQDFSYLTNFMTANNINQSNVPAINQVQQAVQAKVLDPGAVAAFQAGIASLRTNYAALLGARNETPTQAGADALALIPDNLSPAQLTQVQNALNVNGGNIINANQTQLQTILSRYGGTAGSTGVTDTSASAGGWGSLGD